MVVFSFSRVKHPKKNCSLSFDYVTADDEGIHPSIHPSVALQPLPGFGLPHKMPSFISICGSSPPSSYPQQL